MSDYTIVIQYSKSCTTDNTNLCKYTALKSWLQLPLS